MLYDKSLLRHVRTFNDSSRQDLCRAPRVRCNDGLRLLGRDDPPERRGKDGLGFSMAMTSRLQRRQWPAVQLVDGHDPLEHEGEVGLRLLDGDMTMTPSSVAATMACNAA